MWQYNHQSLTHHGVKGMKWGVRKNKSLNSFELRTTEIMIGKTPAKQFKWFDNNGLKVAEFKTFKWWDGVNVCDLEIFGKYKGRGLSYDLLDYATKKCGVKNLSVEKSNDLAKKIYDKYGFETMAQDDSYYYMTLNKPL